ncbi:MAG: hypothetical protein Q7U85_02010 [Rhodocyclaceae bacterium]|nr:hypothetical protein [Rhodocyclaceae bacterium]
MAHLFEPLKLHASLHSWGTPDFAATLKRELADHAAALPLQQALTTTSAVADDAIEVVFLDATADGNCIHAKVGIFCGGILAGCSCADDPTPIEPQTEYCEMLLVIDKATAETIIRLAG